MSPSQHFGLGIRRPQPGTEAKLNTDLDAFALKVRIVNHEQKVLCGWYIVTLATAFTVGAREESPIGERRGSAATAPFHEKLTGTSI